MSCFILLDLMLDDVIASGSSASAASGTASGVWVHACGDVLFAPLHRSLVLSSRGEGLRVLGAPMRAGPDVLSLRRKPSPIGP